MMDGTRTEEAAGRQTDATGLSATTNLASKNQFEETWHHQMHTPCLNDQTQSLDSSHHFPPSQSPPSSSPPPSPSSAPPYQPQSVPTPSPSATFSSFNLSFFSSAAHLVCLLIAAPGRRLVASFFASAFAFLCAAFAVAS